jgi:hypothetical protein
MKSTVYVISEPNLVASWFVGETTLGMARPVGRIN